MKKLKLIVGLGNYKKKYNSTRHNLGFQLIKTFAKKYSLKFQNKKEIYGNIIETKLFNNKIILLMPRTFMNNCGISVKKTIYYYNLNVKEILVVYDEMDIQIGKAKIKFGGKKDQHNGIKSIKNYLKQSEFYRLKIGIGRPKKKIELSKFLLDKPKENEKILIKNSIKKSILCIERILNQGFDTAISFLHSN